MIGDFGQNVLWLDRGAPGGTATDLAAVGTGPLARCFVVAAHREAAASRAYRCLHRDLAFHGAPTDLLAAVSRAAVEEGWHSLQTTELAVNLGAAVPRPVESDPRERALEELACANEIEGCVRETFGAAMALHQARHAREHRIAAMMRGIASQERDHAHLAWQIAAWLHGRLGPRPRRRLLDARVAAVESLIDELGATNVDYALMMRAGVPSSEVAVELARRLQRSLWRVAPSEVEDSPGFVGNGIFCSLHVMPVRERQQTLPTLDMRVA